MKQPFRRISGEETLKIQYPLALNGGSPYLRLKPFSEKMIVIPKSRFWRLSLGVKRSSLAFFREIATHLSGARNDMSAKGSPFLPRDLGDSDSVRAQFFELLRSPYPN
jgi:hypothetical protein